MSDIDWKQYAEDHGYVRIRCRIHGPSWSDSGCCEDCLDDQEEYQADKPEDEETEEVQ